MSQPTIAAIPPKEGEIAPPTAAANNASPSGTDPTGIPDTSNDAALSAMLAAQEEEQVQGAASEAGAASSTIINNSNNMSSSNSNAGPTYSVAHSSFPWQYDDLHDRCRECGDEFNPLNRKHHCRLCGNIFCHRCTDQKALIPPSRIVLHPVGGKKAKPRPLSAEHASFSPDPDPDRMLTYVVAAQRGGGSSTSDGIPNNNGGGGEQLLYGKGLEERFQLAREPIRVCRACHDQLQPLQAELRSINSHSVRFNYVDPTDARRLFNSPLAFTLGHEIRKAAYTLNNLLPQPKRRAGAFVMEESSTITYQSEIQHCQDQCSGLSPNLGDLDGVKIPAVLLENAKGVAVLTVVKGGFGLAGAEFGTGLVVARLPSPERGSVWSAPSAIGTAGLSWGALLGAQVSDHVFLLMTDAAVNIMFSNKASVQLGADVGVAVGPLGRALEGDWGVDGKEAASIYTYSLSKGLYAGVSLDGKVIVTRENVNEKFYGCKVSAQEILAGAVPTPPAAQPLYEALQRCHVYASAAARSQPAGGDGEARAIRNEYGEVAEPGTGLPLSRDHHSVGAMSDITDF
jgi:SH3 domain-containing YSC84-like protein 1